MLPTHLIHCAALAAAISASATTVLADDGGLQIDLHYTLTKDRLSPQPKAGIVDARSDVVTLSGNNVVADQVQRDAKRHLKARAFKNEGTLGEAGERTQWTVEGPHGLKGIIKMGDAVVVMQVQVDEGRSACALDVKILPPNGQSEVHARWGRDRSQTATFANLRVTATTCQLRRI